MQFVRTVLPDETVVLVPITRDATIKSREDK